ncbi:laccase [Ceratobasidium sp. AG-Ba]|nr:laccase [Ceratobasidium sp. AG-Ba]
MENSSPVFRIHKHGVKGWFLGWGSGVFPYNTVAEAAAAGLPGLNLVDPEFRDTFVTPPGLEAKTGLLSVSNPLTQVPHLCIVILLIATYTYLEDPHLAVGMAVLLLEGIDKWPTVPRYYLAQH